MNRGAALLAIIALVPIAKLLFCFVVAHRLHKRHTCHGGFWAMLRKVIFPHNQHSDDRDLDVDLIKLEKMDLRVNALLALAATVAIAVILTTL